jgi:hypothetical protein
MPTLGAPIVFTVKDSQRTKTGKGPGRTVYGSHYHAELTQFAGQVSRVYPDDSACVVIFPPGRLPITIDHVIEGEGPGHFLPFELSEPDLRPPPTMAEPSNPMVGYDTPERPHADASSEASPQPGVPAVADEALTESEIQRLFE